MNSRSATLALTVATAVTPAVPQAVAHADLGGPPRSVSSASSEPAESEPAESEPAESEPDDGPPSVSPADIEFQHRTLRPGTAREVGLLPQYIDRIRTDAERYLSPTADHPDHPTYPGAAILAAKDGVVVQRTAVGKAVRYSAVGPPPGLVGVELPAADQIPARPDTIYDLVSLSKLFTVVVVMQQVERGLVDLDTPVADYLPEFAAGGKEEVTVRNLLTHTGGLPADLALWRDWPDPPTRLAAALAVPLMPDAVPDEQYLYSDLGLIALGELVHRVTGQRLDEAVRTGITGPLAMRETGYNPAKELRPRIAATEYETQPARGMVWGEVHDESAWSLGGVAGHAGVFSTVDDLAIFCQLLLDGGEYRGRRILREDTVRSMLVNYNAHLADRFPDSARGLGFELNKQRYMGAMSSPVTFGHTGFTGTSIVIDPLAHSFLILLSNRVHPSRDRGGNNNSRAALATDLADAVPVRPPAGGKAWRAERRDDATLTLTAPLRAAATDEGEVSFQLWYDTEPSHDRVRFETSADGGETWSPATMWLRSPTSHWQADGTVSGYGGRRWWEVRAELDPGTTDVRWTYLTGPGAQGQGRGVYVDQVFARDASEVLFNGEAGDAGRFLADGWVPSAN